MNSRGCRRTTGFASSLAILASAAFAVPTLGQSAQTPGGPPNHNATPEQERETTPAVGRLQEKATFVVRGDEQWSDVTGFGKDSALAEMMTLMMVGGSGMEHMRMSPLKPGPNVGRIAASRTDQSGGISVTATLTRNPPPVGENVLELLLVDETGKPITGLKLVAAVAMTSMNMGTEHPKAAEVRAGYYSIPIEFSMKGPWRIVVTNEGRAPKGRAVTTILDMLVDGKTKWVGSTGARGTETLVREAARETGSTADSSAANRGKNADGGTGSGTPARIVESRRGAVAESTATTVRPQSVTEPAAGNGDKSDSSTTSLDRVPPKEPDTSGVAPQIGDYRIAVLNDPKGYAVGSNRLNLLVLDPDGKPVSGAKVAGAVEMTNMDMGVTRQSAVEGKPGHYSLSVRFAMKGPWRVTFRVAPPKKKPFIRAVAFQVGP